MRALLRALVPLLLAGVAPAGAQAPDAAPAEAPAAAAPAPTDAAAAPAEAGAAPAADGAPASAPTNPPATGEATPAPAVTADATREADYAAALAAQPGIGEIVKLGTEPAQFIALFQPAQAPAAPLGAVLILHDLGRHPDWPAIVRPLRLGLPPGGFATLAVQLPVLSASAPRADYGGLLADSVTRVRAAVADLQARAPGPLAIVGHGYGALAALRCVAEDGCGAAALALVGLPAGDDLVPPADPLADLARAALPVFDLYASRDRPDVLRLAPRRAQVGRASSGAWRQLALDAVDHDHTGSDEVLVRYVRGWLAKTFTAPPPAAPAPDAAPAPPAPVPMPVPAAPAPTPPSVQG